MSTITLLFNMRIYGEFDYSGGYEYTLTRISLAPFNADCMYLDLEEKERYDCCADSLEDLVEWKPYNIIVYTDIEIPYNPKTKAYIDSEIVDYARENGVDVGIELNNGMKLYRDGGNNTFGGGYEMGWLKCEVYKNGELTKLKFEELHD